MKNEELFRIIVEILLDEFEIKKNRIKTTSSFYYDLKLDSLDMVDFSLLLEKETKILIPTEKLKNVSTIMDFMHLVKEVR